MTLIGLIDSWTTNPLEVGPIYPFVGSERLMMAGCAAYFVAFMVWKLSTESTKYAQRVRHLREQDELTKALAVNPVNHRLAEHNKSLV